MGLFTKDVSKATPILRESSKDRKSERNRRVDAHRASNAALNSADISNTILSPAPKGKRLDANILANSVMPLAAVNETDSIQKVGAHSASNAALTMAATTAAATGGPAVSRASEASRSSGSAPPSTPISDHHDNQPEKNERNLSDEDDPDDYPADDADNEDDADDADDPDEEEPDDAEEEDDDADADPEDDDEEIGKGNAGNEDDHHENINNKETSTGKEKSNKKDDEMDDVTATDVPPILSANTTADAAFTRRASRTRFMYGTRRFATPLVLSATMDEYREACLKLEKARHSRVYEAEKRLLQMEQTVLSQYENEARRIQEEYEVSRRVATRKALVENADKILSLERRRHGVLKDDDNMDGMWTDNGGRGLNDGVGGSSISATLGGGGGNSSFGFHNLRKHDFGLRGRDDKHFGDDEIHVDVSEKPRKTRKAENRHQKVKINIELDEQDILADLAELHGEKRTRDPDAVPTSSANQPDRKVKKKKL